MSREEITINEIGSTEKVQTQKTDSISKRVNINQLLLKVRKEKKKEKKENYIFLVAIFGVIAVTGIIASL